MSVWLWSCLFNSRTPRATDAEYGECDRCFKRECGRCFKRECDRVDTCLLQSDNGLCAKKRGTFQCTEYVCVCVGSAVMEPCSCTIVAGN